MQELMKLVGEDFIVSPDIPENKWLIRAESCRLSFVVYFSNSASPAEAFKSFDITTDMAWKAPNMRFVASRILAYVFSGKGPLRSNSWAALSLNVSSRVKNR